MIAFFICIGLLVFFCHYYHGQPSPQTEEKRGIIEALFSGDRR